MEKYFRIERVQVVQFSEAMALGTEDLPPGVRMCRRTQRSGVLIDHGHVFDGGLNEAISVGDWLVYGEDGKNWAMTDDGFREAYCSVEPNSDAPVAQAACGLLAALDEALPGWREGSFGQAGQPGADAVNAAWDHLVAAAEGGVTRQAAALGWATETFGPIARNHEERASRLLEECLEFAQAEGLSLELATRIANRVYSRPAGRVEREIAQVAMTLDAAAENLGINVQSAAAAELARVREIPAEEMMRRHAAKADLGIATMSPRQ